MVKTKIRGDVLSYVGNLIVETCPECGINQGVPDGLIRKAKENHRTSIYCPLGHSWHYIGETEAEKERRLRKWAEDRAASERARADGAEASLRTTKGHVTRLRKQVLAGACPFCGQHLRDLERHIARQHKTEPEEDE